MGTNAWLPMGVAQNYTGVTQRRFWYPCFLLPGQPILGLPGFLSRSHMAMDQIPKFRPSENIRFNPTTKIGAKMGGLSSDF